MAKVGPSRIVIIGRGALLNSIAHRLEVLLMAHFHAIGAEHKKISGRSFCL